MSDSWNALRARWWAGWARFFPEDATSLGVRGHERRLRDSDGAVGDAERAFHESMLSEIARIDVRQLDSIARIEWQETERTSRFRAHVLDACDHDRTCLELSLHPHGMIAHHLTHARDGDDLADAQARLEALPAALRAREAALFEGIARGHVPDASIVAVVIGFALPGASRAYAALPASLRSRGLAVDDVFAAACARAAAATSAHCAFVERVVAPSAVAGAARLGEDELGARLGWTYGEPISARAIRDEASEAVTLLSAKLVVSAARAASARDLRVRDLRSAHAYVRMLTEEHPDASADPRQLYAAFVDRASRFAVERHLFRVPDAAPDYVAIPDGMIHGGSITNWPAPLADRSRRGHVAIASSPSAHALAFMPNLAIHEATPGHHLQSAVWSERHDVDREPVRFVAVHDDVAMASSWFGAMPTIEGFAVHAEEVMLDAGFHDRDGEVAAIASGLIRAARAVTDMSLHLREWTVERASDEMERMTGMPRSFCDSQVVRFLRIPIQATTYFVGARRHRAMLDDARVRQGAAFRADAFHDALLAIGPATLSTLAARMGEQLGAR